MILRQIAHARSGDKGDISNIAVIAYHMEDYAYLCRLLTASEVKRFLGAVVKGEVHRYEIPDLGALNFVLQRTLGGGVTRSLALDAHGKCLSSVLLSMKIEER